MPQREVLVLLDVNVLRDVHRDEEKCGLSGLGTTCEVFPLDGFFGHSGAGSTWEVAPPEVYCKRSGVGTTWEVFPLLLVDLVTLSLFLTQIDTRSQSM